MKKAIKLLTIVLLTNLFVTAKAQVMGTEKCYVQMALKNHIKNDAEKDKPLIIFLSDVLEVQCLNDLDYHEPYKIDFQFQFFKHLYEKYPEEIIYFNSSNLTTSRLMEDSKDELETYLENSMGYHLSHPDSEYQVIRVKDFVYQPMMFVPGVAFDNGKYTILEEPDAQKRELYRKWWNTWQDIRKK